MAFKQVLDLDAENTIALGGFNKKLKKDNPKSVEGYFLGTRQVESKKAKTGFASIHYFQTPHGNIAVWGKTDLDRKLGNITPGTMVRATFDKMQATPNGEMYKYRVEIDEDNTIEVGTLSAGSRTAAVESYDTDEEEGNLGGAYDNDDGAPSDEDVATLAAEQAARAAKVQEMLKRKRS